MQNMYTYPSILSTASTATPSLFPTFSLEGRPVLAHILMKTDDKDVTHVEADEEAKPKKEGIMDKVLGATANPPSIDDVVEGTVIGIEKTGVYIDIPPFGTGIIYGREYINA